jgi:NitT/TauT family transport system permease protein
MTESAADWTAGPQARHQSLLERSRTTALRRRRTERLIILLGQAAVILFLLGAWDFASGRLVDAEAVSDPISVLTTLWSLVVTGRLWPDLWQTLVEVLLGFGIGSAIGLALALVFALAPSAQAVLRPFLIAFYAVPKIALAPLIIMWLGLDTLPKVVMAATFVFFVVFMNAAGGIEAVNPQHVMLARIMGGKRLTILRKIVLPSALPFLITGFRLAIPEAVIGAVIGEFIAADSGLGHLVSSASSQFNMAVSIAAIFVLLGIVAVADVLLNLVEQRTLRFQAGWANGSAGRS